MSPTIDIDDETFTLLQEHAEPLIDTPASVLRRLLELNGRDGDATRQSEIAPASTDAEPERPKARPRKKTRAARGSLLPEAQYEMPILRFLDQNGGRAPSREIIDAVGTALKDELTEADHEELNSGDIRWKNRAAFVRLRLIEKGELDGNAPRGTWAITAKGSKRVANSNAE
jgi:Mrr N-terminal domain